jgi:GNAT superfamily N-acetyltransferase
MTSVVVSKVNPSDQKMLMAIGRLRVRVWSTVIPEASGMETWLDEHDSSARHWVANVGGELVAAARMSIHLSASELADIESFPDDVLAALPTPIASFNRLVVAETARRLGIGRRLDALRLAKAEQLGCRCAVGATPSGPSRIRQLEMIGFQVVSRSGGYRQGPFAYRPTFDEAVLVCYLPRRADCHGS